MVLTGTHSPQRIDAGCAATWSRVQSSSFFSLFENLHAVERTACTTEGFEVKSDGTADVGECSEGTASEIVSYNDASRDCSNAGIDDPALPRCVDEGHPAIDCTFVASERIKVIRLTQWLLLLLELRTREGLEAEGGHSPADYRVTTRPD